MTASSPRILAFVGTTPGRPSVRSRGPFRALCAQAVPGRTSRRDGCVGNRATQGSCKLRGPDTILFQVCPELVQDLLRVTHETRRADLHCCGAGQHELGLVRTATEST